MFKAQTAFTKMNSNHGGSWSKRRVWPALAMLLTFNLNGADSQPIAKMRISERCFLNIEIPKSWQFDGKLMMHTKGALLPQGQLPNGAATIGIRKTGASAIERVLSDVALIAIDGEAGLKVKDFRIGSSAYQLLEVRYSEDEPFVGVNAVEILRTACAQQVVFRLRYRTKSRVEASEWNAIFERVVKSVHDEINHPGIN